MAKRNIDVDILKSVEEYIKEKEYKLKEYYIETILSKEPLTIIRIYNQAVIVSELSFQIPLPLEIIEPLQPSWIYQKGE